MTSSAIGASDNATRVDVPPARVHTAVRRATETKASFKTTEFWIYVACSIGVMLAALLVKSSDGHNDYFRMDKAMLYVVLLTVGYLFSRGLAKAGSREPYTADDRH
jgi:hypothetical protein